MNASAASEAKAFDDHYRELVYPRLLPFINVAAHLLHLGEATFSEASSFVMSEATRLGATSLSSTALDALTDWVDARLLRHFELPSPRWMVTRAQLRRIREDLRQGEGASREQSERAE